MLCRAAIGVPQVGQRERGTMRLNGASPLGLADASSLEDFGRLLAPLALQHYRQAVYRRR